MTPKEKANEICNKMLYQIDWNAQPSTVKGVAKKCALIAVDEILNDLSNINYGIEYLGRRDYWQEVKQEIEKL